MPLHKFIVGYVLNNLCVIPLVWKKVQTKPEQRHGAAFTQLLNRLSSWKGIWWKTTNR